VSKQDIICIVARQRSGTTALQAILGCTGRIANFGEIFQTGQLDRSGSFFGYCRERNILLSDVALAPALSQLMHDYMGHLRQLAGERHVLIDVKFNSWDAVRPAWRYPQEEPYFLALLKSLKALFIFIQRLDVAAQIVSAHIARANDQWQNLSLATAPAAPLDIDIGKAEREARKICVAEAFLWRSLKKYKRVLHFTYESLYEEDNLAADARQRICSALGEELRFPSQPPIRKSGVDKASTVRNYAELVAAVGNVVERYRRSSAGPASRAGRQADVETD
jgi:LPS sulfotransferase NodH